MKKDFIRNRRVQGGHEDEVPCCCCKKEKEKKKENKKPPLIKGGLPIPMDIIYGKLETPDKAPARLESI